MEIQQFETHINYLNDWITWKNNGIGTVRWSENYRIICVPYVRKFIEQYHTVSAANLEACLSNVPFESQSKRKHIHSAVSSFADFLQCRSILSTEERAKIRKLYPHRSRYCPPKKLIIDSNDLQVLIETATKGLHRYQRTLNVALLIFLSETALRVSEACKLKLDEINLTPDQLPYIRVVQGKGGKDRVVPLTIKAVTAIENYLKVRPDVPFTELFIGFNPTTGYTPLNRSSVARRFKAISKASGVRFTAHSLRHYRITAWAKNPKLTLPIVQKLAGHSSVVITESYINLSTDDVFEAFHEIA